MNIGVVLDLWASRIHFGEVWGRTGKRLVESRIRNMAEMCRKLTHVPLLFEHEQVKLKNSGPQEPASLTQRRNAKGSSWALKTSVNCASFTRLGCGVDALSPRGRLGTSKSAGRDDFTCEHWWLVVSICFNYLFFSILEWRILWRVERKQSIIFLKWGASKIMRIQPPSKVTPPGIDGFDQPHAAWLNAPVHHSSHIFNRTFIGNSWKQICVSWISPIISASLQR